MTEPHASSKVIDDWKMAAGITTDNAAANALCVHRHTLAKMRTRYLTKVERLAMAAIQHKIQPVSQP